MMISRSTLAAATIAFSLTGLAAAPAHAQSKCNSASKVTSAIWAKYDTELKKVGCKKGGEKCSKMEAVVREMVSFWNQQAGNGWATIGPREILFEGKLSGRIVAGGERVFVTKLPLVDADTVTVEVEKEGGKAPAIVSISLVDEQGRCVEGNEVSFDGGSGRGNIKRLSISGARDRVVVIKVDAKQGKAFEYQLTVRAK
jgi:hypothetical protein